MPTTAGTPTSAGSQQKKVYLLREQKQGTETLETSEQKEANNKKDACKGADSSNSKDASNRRDGKNSTYYRDANRSKNISNSSGGISSKLIGTSWIATSSGTMAAAGMLATV
jgi:hypothetical protein